MLMPLFRSVFDDLIGRYHTRPSVIQSHFESLRRYKAPVTHNQFGTARLVIRLRLPRVLVPHGPLAVFLRHV
jgi:hypothetical protein